MKITCCDSMSDTFDRPSWYRNMIGKRETTVARLRIRGRIQKKRESEIAIIRINRFYKCYRGPEGCVYLLRVLRAAVVTCQWMNIKRNASKSIFLWDENKDKTMYYKRSYKYYVINYYYCYDYYLQWLLHHYRIIRRLNKFTKKKIQIYICMKYYA